MAKTTKPHPEDIAQAEAVKGALYFTAFFRRGPHDAWLERDIATYDQARKRADALAAEYNAPGQRKLGLVYAVCPGNFSVLCTPEVMALVLALEPESAK